MDIDLVLPTAVLSFALSAASLAATLPVSEDTYSFSPGKIDKRSGNASTLPVSANGTAFIRFDAGDFSGLIKSSDVTSARLTFYITEAGKAGKIGIHRVTSEWTESPAAARNAPSFDPEPLVTIPAKAVGAGQFAVIDVTTQVRKWLDEPQSDRGFAITGADGASIQIRAKEGSAAGMSASLEIDNHPVVSNKQLADGINATKLGNGEVSNAEFAQLNGVTAPLQQQIDGLKAGTGNLGGTVEALQTGLAAVEGDVDALQAGAAAMETANAGFTESIGNLNQDIDGLWDYCLNERVSKDGDTMTGTLFLPQNGLYVGKTDLVTSAGRVGIGTASPQAKLDVRGEIRLGSTGELRAPAGVENLLIVRGTFYWTGNTLTIESGSGFTVTRNERERYTVNFNAAFTDTPAITYSIGYPQLPTTVGLGAIGTITGKAANLLIGEPNNTSVRVNFIAIGQRR